MRYVVTYERPDGTLGRIWNEDWLRIMLALYEATTILYTPRLSRQPRSSQ